MSPDRQSKATSRRAFFQEIARLAMRALVAAAALLGFLSLRQSRAMPAGARRKLGILRPPGSLDEPDFLAHCIRCRRCADACEPQCIDFFGPEAGSRHGTPYILPEEKGCTLCLKCGETCPSGAITTLQREEDARMGIAVVDERLCVTYVGEGRSRVCGVCHTACPLRDKAITLVDNRPMTHSQYCVGCGLCEAACVVKDRRAIQVRSARKWIDFDRI